MNSTELLILLPFAGLALLLWYNLKAREAALVACRALCKSEGLLFLDDTVAMRSLKPVRDSRGRLRLQRVFVFEYSDTGNNRCEGAAILLGDAVTTMQIGPRPMPDGQLLH